MRATADKAVKIPFREFMAGMQNDAAMPRDDENFRPLFVGFVWPGVPFKKLQRLIGAASAALSENCADADDPCACDDSAPDDPAPDEDAAEEGVSSADASSSAATATAAPHLGDGYSDSGSDDASHGDDAQQSDVGENPLGCALNDVFSALREELQPVEHAVFGRLIARARAVGTGWAVILGKLLRAAQPPSRPRLSLMANSLGVHVVLGALHAARQQLPYRPAAALLVAGAVQRKEFASGGGDARLCDNLAGPLVATFSRKDYLLRNVFGPFHGCAVGYAGFGVGDEMIMRAVEDIGEYEFGAGRLVSVDGTEYIKDGNFFEGGHGDFKDDETTSLYWSMVLAEYDSDLFDWVD